VEPGSDRFSSSSPSSQDQESDKLQPPSIIIKKFVDYSAKYGVGYMLTDDTTGVCFNDQSRLFQATNQEVFHFHSVTRDAQNQRQEDQKSYAFGFYPQELLGKKVHLFQTFSKYLKKDASTSLKVTKLS
jgi:hypothetical protein